MDESVSAETDLMDSSSDMKGFIRLTGQIGGIGNTSNNRIAIVPIEPDTSYDISISADNRFRAGTLNTSDLKTDFFLENYYVSPKDDNAASFIGDDSCTLISGSNHDLLVIFYWTGTSVQSSDTIRNSISVLKTPVTLSGDAEGGILVGSEWSYSPVISQDGTAISVAGADWLSVQENIISGVPEDIGTYHVTIVVEKSGYSSAVKEISITVVSVLEFTSTSDKGVTFFE